MTVYLSKEEVEEMMPDPNRDSFKVPIGPSTKMGVYGTSVLAVVALVTAVLDGDHTPETMTALFTATFLLATTIYGRMKQAAAVYHNAPTPLEGVTSAVGVLVDETSTTNPTVGRPEGTQGGRFQT
jgi:ABC-type transport system involved in cytochrome bd biosynthesis fused ATPase/permease subunit